MTCQDANERIADYLAGTLSPPEREALRAHAASCQACHDDLRASEDTWDRLEKIPAIAPDLDSMRRRFDAFEVGWSSRVHGRSSRLALAGLAAAVLVLGIAIGRQMAVPSTASVDRKMDALRSEMLEIRQTLSLSLLQQSSATARLQGVLATQEISDPRSEVIAALLDALQGDPNVNVRLAAVGALGRFGDRDQVKREAVRALTRQTSPLVQVELIDFVVRTAGAESVDALRALSTDGTTAEAVRHRALQALRAMGVSS